MKVWRVSITASEYVQGPPRHYSYTGTAATADIAIREMERVAKKDGLSKTKVLSVDMLGKKEFGR